VEESISLNKFISDTGYCSRRVADQLIEAGRVLLNNKKAKLGNRFKPGDTVEVDGSFITAPKKEKQVYIALNKPVGITCTTELHVKGNIISFMDYPKRIFPIGRIDKDSQGLIFLTNDGDVVNKILRAGNEHEKEYIVRVNKPLDNGFAQRMSEGLPILDTITLPCKVSVMGRQTFRITLMQGLNRQIRRMCEYLGYEVVNLERTRIMNIKLDKLAAGKWRYLSDAEIQQLKDSVKDSAGDAGKLLVKQQPPQKKHSEKIAIVAAEKKVNGKKIAAKKQTPTTQKIKSVTADKPAASKKSGSYKDFKRRGRGGEGSEKSKVKSQK
jgi:23S rRNA pseudouridine2604 synthase